MSVLLRKFRNFFDNSIKPDSKQLPETYSGLMQLKESYSLFLEEVPAWLEDKIQEAEEAEKAEKKIRQQLALKALLGEYAGAEPEELDLGPSISSPKRETYWSIKDGGRSMTPKEDIASYSRDFFGPPDSPKRAPSVGPISLVEEKGADEEEPTFSSTRNPVKIHWV